MISDFTKLLKASYVLGLQGIQAKELKNVNETQKPHESRYQKPPRYPAGAGTFGCPLSDTSSLRSRCCSDSLHSHPFRWHVSILSPTCPLFLLHVIILALPPPLES